jgi:acetyl-CoA C-acetyltransferase
MAAPLSPRSRAGILAGHLRSPSPQAAAAASSTSIASQPTAARDRQGLEEVWIVGYARTPIGASPLNGAFASLTAPQLGGFAIREAVKRAGIKPTDVDACFMGNVLQAGVGQAPARQAALAGGLPITTPCTTINKVCASAMKSYAIGVDAIRVGAHDVVVVGGMESMSNTPFYLTDTRNGKGLKVGNAVAVDGMIYDGLTDAYTKVHMGTAAELTAQKYHITRAQQDEYARRSYERAQAATKAGKFAREIVPVTVKGKDGKMVTITQDEEPFRAKFERFATLKPTFPTTVKGVSPPNQPAPLGTVTAANSSVIGDGAAALVLMSATKARQMGINPIARAVSQADAELAPLDYPVTPEKACRAAISRAGLSGPEAIDLWELNEAFAVVSLVNMQLLGIDPSKICINGGAISLGHPIGCSGARIICTLLNALEQENKKLGCAALCNGGGGASAVVVERL